MKRVLLWVLVFLLSLFLTATFSLAGCKKAEEVETSEEVGSEEKSEAKPAEELLIYASMGGPAGAAEVNRFVAGADAAIEQWGCEVVKQFAEWQSDVMVQQFKEAIAANPDGIVVMGHPGDDAMAPFVDEAFENGIIVTTSNTPLPKLEEKYMSRGFGYVGSDLYNVGVNLANQTIIGAGLKEGDKVLNYGLKSQPTRGLIDQGIEERCKEEGLVYDYVEISEEVNADASLAVPVITGYLSANPDCKAIILFHAILTSTAQELITAAGLGPDDIFFAGCDLGPKTVTAIQDGYVDVIIDQQLFLQGFLPIEQICLTKLYQFTGLHVDTGRGFVTKDNIDDMLPLIDQEIR